MPGKRKRMSEEARREQLLSAAFAVALREGLSETTIRAVAAEAQVSHGLVLHHFKRKDGLMRDLLDALIEKMAVLHMSEDIARFPRAMDRLHALLQQEMARLSRQPQHTRLFLEFWALGGQHEGIRKRISREIARYRAAFLVIIDELLDAEPGTFSGITAEGLATVAVSWIHGCAVHATLDSGRFDADQYLAAVRGVIGQLA